MTVPYLDSAPQAKMFFNNLHSKQFAIISNGIQNCNYAFMMSWLFLESPLQDLFRQYQRPLS